MPAYGSEEMYRFQPRIAGSGYTPQYAGISQTLNQAQIASNRNRHDIERAGDDYAAHQRWMGEQFKNMPREITQDYRDARRFATEEQRAQYDQKFAEQRLKGNEYTLGEQKDRMEQREQQRAFDNEIDEKTGKSHAQSARELQYRTPFTEEERGNTRFQREGELFPLQKRQMESSINANNAQIADASFNRQRAIEADAAQAFAMAGNDPAAIENVKLTYGKRLPPAMLANAQFAGGKIAAKNTKDTAATELVTNPLARTFMAKQDELNARLSGLEELSQEWRNYQAGRAYGMNSAQANDAAQKIVKTLHAMGEDEAADRVANGFEVDLVSGFKGGGFVHSEMDQIKAALDDVAQRTQLQIGAMNQRYQGLNNPIINQGLGSGQTTLTSFRGAMQPQPEGPRDFTPDDLAGKQQLYPGITPTARQFTIDQPKPAKAMTGTRAPR